ncbi:radical SAM protein, partial [Xanthomonas citri pv. citri]
CEFCDIIELYGRSPRTKTTPQMLAELDRLYSLGHRGHVDFVDDNLIGNKKAIKLFLPHLIKWQEAHGYPFKFSTEASLNLADDDELLGMMRDANFFALFTGIETPDEATLIQTQKKQNTKRSIADSVHKLYEHGMFVTAGFIVGFDTEKDSIAKA